MSELRDENESGIVQRPILCKQSDRFTPSNTELRKLAAEHGPPQSWFEEEAEEKPW